MATFALVTLCILVSSGLFIAIVTFVYFEAINPMLAVLPALFMVTEHSQLIMCLTVVSLAGLSFYLISSPSYQKYLAHQSEVIAMYQQAKKEVAAEMAEVNLKRRNK